MQCNQRSTERRSLDKGSSHPPSSAPVDGPLGHPNRRSGKGNVCPFDSSLTTFLRPAQVKDTG